MKKAWAYVRVSSDEQTKGNGIPEQTANVENYCPRTGLDREKTLIDNGFSASTGEHLSKGKLGIFVTETKKGKHKGEALVVSEMDRLSRQGIRETRKLIDSLTENGVEIHITQTGRIIRDTEDLFSDIMNSLESHGAAEYSRKLSERIGKAWAAKKRNAGAKVVTANTPWWLEVADGKIVEIPEKVALIREMFRLAVMGLGSKKIAFKIDSGLAIGTIQKTLANRSVLGDYQPCRYVSRKRVPDGDAISGYYPAIISPSVWAAARAEIDRKNRMPDRSRRFCSKSDRADNLFTGLILDTSTRPVRTMFFQKKSAKNSTFLVSSYDRLRHRKANRYPYAKFEKAFLGFLRDLDWQAIADHGMSDEELESQKRLDTKLTELDRVERRITRTKEALDAEDIDPGALRILAGKLAQDEALAITLTQEKDALQASLEACRATTQALSEPDALIEAIRDLSNVEMRLRARTEIRKRVNRVEFNFRGETKPGILVRFVNGVAGIILTKDDKALLVKLDKTPRTASQLLDAARTVTL